ncbi:hypothetical protein PHSC3_000682 [Chlamydiales bacterium STE3]|nr:hypothetical protein PHSC3_000682 [Chlamydiales bacterium STE3]
MNSVSTSNEMLVPVPSLQKLCIQRIAPLWVNKIDIDEDGVPSIHQSYNGKKSKIFGKFGGFINGKPVQTIHYPTHLIDEIEKEAKKLKYNNKCFISFRIHENISIDPNGVLTPVEVTETVAKVKEIAADYLRARGSIKGEVYIWLSRSFTPLLEDQKLSEHFEPGDHPTLTVRPWSHPFRLTDKRY